MNEQDISKAVEAVLGQMNGQHAHHGEGHVCRCNKNKMTLKLANIYFSEPQDVNGRT